MARRRSGRPRGARCTERRWTGRCARAPESPPARPTVPRARASQTASKAGECPPDSTSTGKPAAASRSSGISASHEGLSRLSSSTPCMSSSGSCSGVPIGGAGAAAEQPQELLRRDRGGVLEEALSVGDHLVDHRRSLCHPQAAGLRDGQRADRLGPLGGGEQCDHRAVGMPDQVGAVAEQLGEHRRLHLEVVSLQRRALTEAGAAGNDQAPALGELTLLPPGEGRADDVAVDEEDRRPRRRAAQRRACSPPSRPAPWPNKPYDHPA